MTHHTSLGTFFDCGKIEELSLNDFDLYIVNSHRFCVFVFLENLIRLEIKQSFTLNVLKKPIHSV